MYLVIFSIPGDKEESGDAGDEEENDGSAEGNTNESFKCSIIYQFT